MNIHQDHSDRRTTARFSMLEYALIGKDESGASVRSVVIDVSLGGLQVRSREQFNSGSEVVLSIGRVLDNPIEVRGEVMYSVALPETDLYSTGFSVKPVTPHERMRWADYVHTIFQNRSEELV